jgi:non-homologous end joining protein Ku
MLHTMYFADEIRDFGEIEKGKSVKLRDGELQLAERLIDELSLDSVTQICVCDIAFCSMK